MNEVKVDKQYFDIEIDENDNIISDYKIKSGVSKKHLALKLLKKKGFDTSIIADAEYLYDKLQGFDNKKEKAESVGVKEEVLVEEVVLDKDIVVDLDDIIEEDINIVLDSKK